MRVLLTTLNAKYIHAALGIHTIKAYAESHGFKVIVQEYTINQDLGWILSHLMRQKPEALGISCNIWNVDETKALIRRIKKIAPKLLLIIGGPEFSAAPESFIDCGADFGIIGEGEKPFLNLLEALTTGNPYDAVPGIVWKDGERLRTNSIASPISMDELPFPYSEAVLREPGRIFYYETMRGCPFSCSYCLSGTEKVIRKRSLEQVFTDLEKLVAAGIRQVKFVDRTFNADPRRCEMILSYIIEHYGDAGVNFHMELVAELLDDALMAKLNQAPKGLFRAEVGIQSLHAPTLAAVHRHVNPVRLEQNLRNLLRPQNIPIHLDLIAGLPEEGWEAFAGTFDWTFNLRPAEIQLGILKVLKGSELGRKGRELGYLATDEAPYEILETPWLSFGEIQRLKTMAHLVDVLYNSGHFRHALPLLLSGEGRSPFQMFDRLVSRWEQEALDISPPNLKQIFDFLRFSVQELLPTEAGRIIIELLRMDRALADWSFDQGEGWGAIPDLPEALSTHLSDECWVEQNLPMMAELKPMERRRRVRRLTLEVDPRHPANGSQTVHIVLYRPLKGRIGYVVLED